MVDDDLFSVPGPPPEPPEPPPERPVIQYIKADVHDAVDDAIPFVAASDLIYQRSGRLVKVAYTRGIRDGIIREDECPIIMNVTRGYLIEVLSRCIYWMKYDGRSQKLVGCEPPQAVVAAFLDRGEWPDIPILRGVSTIPILRDSGSVCMKQGYDEQSEYFHAPTVDKLSPDWSFDQEGASECCKEILDWVSDFPFAEECHRSAWLAAVLTGVSIPIIDGPTPLTLIDANAPGTGKSLLVDVASVISTGMSAARSPDVRDEEELRKRITSHLMAGDRLCMIDNVRGGSKIGWPALDALLTSETWSDRELGKSGVVRLPAKTQWFVTGNNLAVGTDIARRTLRVRLEASVERPELRSGFKHDPLLREIRRMRRDLMSKALLVVRSYIYAGRPDVGVKPLGSFESWSVIVRNAIIWAGLADPVDALVGNEEGVDEEDSARKVLLLNWKSLKGFPPVEGGITASEALKEIENHRDEYGDIIEALESLCYINNRNGLPSAKSLGRVLNGMLKRIHVIGNERYQFTKKRNRRNTFMWDVEISPLEPDFLAKSLVYDDPKNKPDSKPRTQVPEITDGHGYDGSIGLNILLRGKSNDSFYIRGKNGPYGRHNPHGNNSNNLDKNDMLTDLVSNPELSMQDRKKTECDEKNDDNQDFDEEIFGFNFEDENNED
jgi:putative DNA primase/helicase